MSIPQSFLEQGSNTIECLHDSINYSVDLKNLLDDTDKLIQATEEDNMGDINELRQRLEKLQFDSVLVVDKLVNYQKPDQDNNTAKSFAKELENIKKDNAETQGGLAIKERKVQLLKLEFAGSGGGLNEFKDEAEAIKTQLSKTASDLAAKRAATAEQRQILQERRAKLEQGRQSYTKLRMKLEKEKKMVRTASAAASQLEKDLESLEKSKKSVERQGKFRWM